MRALSDSGEHSARAATAPREAAAQRGWPSRTLPRPGVHPRAAGAGFTLIELLVTVTLVGTFLGSLLFVVGAGTKAARTGMARQSADAQARRTLDRMARALVSSGAGTLVPDPSAPWGTSTLLFQRIQAYSGGAIQWDTPAEFSLELEPGELDDGQDNNDNGLVDERQLVYTLDPDGAAQRVVWVKGVRELYAGETANGLDDNGNGLQDEPGLVFERNGGRLIVRLCLEESDGLGNTLVHAVATTVRLRNTE
jgi:prepilin-type N-terminal cleavage/methylation domain-containing protein